MAVDGFYITNTRKASKEHSTQHIAIIGEASTGKSSIVNALRNKPFNKGMPMTIGGSFTTHIIKHEDKEVRLRLCDVAGQQGFGLIKKYYLKNLAGVVLIFDITSVSSFDNLNSWIYEVLAANNFNTDLPFILVGNKVDLVEERKIKIGDVRRFLNLLDNDNQIKPNIVEYVETSAKTNENVKAIFNKLSQEIGKN